MSRLLLIRHAQASFLAADYDQLSPHGEAQARRLGAWLAGRGLRPDVVFVGPRRRHLQTLEAAASADWPAPTPLDTLDEHHGEHVVKAVLPRLMDEDEAVRRDVRAVQSGGAEASRAFQRLFERITRAWAREEHAPEGVEPWATFLGRVNAGLDQMTADTARGQLALAFTSAGFVGAAAGALLGVSPVKALEMGWMVYNASLTEVLYDDARRSLLSLNGTPHLDEPRWLTWR